MGFRYYRRVQTGKNWGWNISKSGISPSYRTKYGSFGPKGYSIRTGIRGLSYRGGFKGKNSGFSALFFLLLFSVIYIGYHIVKLAFYLLVLLFESIFTKEGINYVYLNLFLGVVLGFLVLVYFNLPDKEVKQTQQTTIVANIDTTIKPISHKIIATKIKKRDTVVNTKPIIKDTISKLKKQLGGIDTLGNKSVEKSKQVVDIDNSVDSLKHLTYIGAIGFINKYCEDKSGSFNQELIQILFKSKVDWYDANRQALYTTQDNKTKIRFQNIYDGFGGLIIKEYRHIQNMPKEQQYDGWTKLLVAIKKLNAFEKKDAKNIDSEMKKTNSYDDIKKLIDY